MLHITNEEIKNSLDKSARSTVYKKPPLSQSSSIKEQFSQSSDLQRSQSFTRSDASIKSKSPKQVVHDRKQTFGIHMDDDELINQTPLFDGGRMSNSLPELH